MKHITNKYLVRKYSLINSLLKVDNNYSLENAKSEILGNYCYTRWKCNTKNYPNK